MNCYGIYSMLGTKKYILNDYTNKWLIQPQATTYFFIVIGFSAVFGWKQTSRNKFS